MVGWLLTPIPLRPYPNASTSASLSLYPLPLPLSLYPHSACLSLISLVLYPSVLMSGCLGIKWCNTNTSSCNTNTKQRPVPLMSNANCSSFYDSTACCFFLCIIMVIIVILDYCFGCFCEFSPPTRPGVGMSVSWIELSRVGSVGLRLIHFRWIE